MLGIIDVGGGTRGVYGAGVFDRCLTDNIKFDYVIGVSAGSANCASYCAGQKGRNYVFYTDYAFRKEYMGLETLKDTGSFIGLDYIYGALSNSDGEYPLDYDAMMASGVRYEIVTANALTGEPVYWQKEDMQKDCYDIIKASCCVPFVNKPYTINGVPYYDGGIADPVPLDRAFAMGCDRVVLVLTKPKDQLRKPGKDVVLAKRIARRYPNAARRLRLRADWYNLGVQLAKAYEAQGKALIVAPDDTCGVDTLTRDKEAMDRLYQKGYADAEAIRGFLQP